MNFGANDFNGLQVRNLEKDKFLEVTLYLSRFLFIQDLESWHRDSFQGKCLYEGC